MKRNLMLAAAFATAFVAVAANAGTTTPATTKYAAEFYSGTATDTLLPAAASSFAFSTAIVLPVGTLVNVTLSEGEWVTPALSTMTATGSSTTQAIFVKQWCAN
ncbi:hypothetical protein [Deefgea sp. CFH1-16]|uniref:hypothetical protein n=1 Tax=Deefgea sp. CFH1-16 TaxID=2675457 RepID=UPI00194030F8|nr:hypothetical protein [Deefgea sp. CFH1-16]